jgi:subtilisin family serine protease
MMGRPTRLRGTGLIAACAAALLAALLAASASHAAPGSPTALSPQRELRLERSRALAAPRFEPGVVLVGFRPGTSTLEREQIERWAGARAGHRLDTLTALNPSAARLERRLGASFLVRVRPGRVYAVVARLRSRRRWVRYAEPDFILQASAHLRSVNLPNDPSFPLQWGDYNTGQSVNGTTGTAGADDGAARAWARSTGNRSIVIGEVDTGVDYTHPDLAANIWTNPGGVGGCPAGTHGYNVVASTCDPMDDDTVYGGHGTHVAGIMGAVGNNGVGVAGMNWQTTILPVKWLDSNASGTTSQLISALNWVLEAKQAGVNVRVVNDSATFVGTAYSQALSDEIDTLGANGILFVTAAGNTGQDNDNPSTPRYPCNYDRPTEICVTASDQNDQLPSWADYGPHTVDLAAPGNNIYSTLRDDSYGYIDGGSMAAAQVSGAAALILSVQNLTPTALKARILASADRISAMAGLTRTGARLDVCAAIPGCTATAVPWNSSAPVISGPAQVGHALSASPGTWTQSPYSYTYAWWRCSATGTGCKAVSGATASSYLVTTADDGSTLEVKVTATNAEGSATATSARTPVVSGQTFGYTSVGLSSDEFAANRKRVNAYSISTSASVSSLSIYLAPTGSSGSSDLEGVIYSDSGGSPSALLGTTAQLVYAGTETAGWYTLKFASPVLLSAGRYWIGVITGGTSDAAGYRYESVSGARDYNTDTYSSGPSNPFGSVISDNEQMSLYASY